jgi:hypothetical protein
MVHPKKIHLPQGFSKIIPVALALKVNDNNGTESLDGHKCLLSDDDIKKPSFLHEKTDSVLYE